MRFGPWNSNRGVPRSESVNFQRMQRNEPPRPESAASSVVELAVGPRLRPLGGLEVNRVWPTARRRTIGPFIFFDHLTLAELPPGRGLDVPPHPHIGLAAVTYLFGGELLHRDSLGIAELIRPGELNWMTAGRGIVHSERTPPEERARTGAIHGVQSWVALPREAEDREPSFEHLDAAALPVVERPGVRLRLLAGEAFGAIAPVATLSRLFYLEADFAAGAKLTLAAGLGERGVYGVHGGIAIGSAQYGPGSMLVLRDGSDVEIRSPGPSKVMLLGGAPLGGERHIWWNFVASSKQRIERAKRDWRERRFPSVPGDDERMPLPE